MSAAVDRKKKLGRGLGALMGEIQREEPLVRENSNDSNEVTAAATGASTSGLKDIPVADISPLPGQPRTHFDDDALDQLAASIAQRGVIQPVIVTPNGAGRYQLVAGERRWRAAQRARLHAIPAIVRDLDKREIMALALIENLQREDLNPLEEARAYQKLSEEEGMTQAEIAQLVDKSRSHVANFQRLLALPDEVLEMLAKGKLTMGHARPLIGNEAAAEIARKAVNDNLSVRDVEKLARGEKPKKAKTDGGAKPVAEAANDADIAAVQGHLEEFLGLPVRIKTEGAPGNGTVTIGYRTLDQLDLICQRLTGGDI
ncbi:ParB/RepB/Spo0J family partition protein [Qipengyuania aurantiaca]|uniref:ParB/RepB/Spo0J family partition protein n=1 Tax=Qipengyuania aurantiaca TaxID=2867233 RepID=A0ABX8ZP59_9SPHN|nr:ParB/RepB/Spo0J family partition protein [Qipengyuania aurantiaca]QZD90806.1 ParB/RepB/Spo0J family partition protein [Qipengyuania aurantiaca]